MDTSVAYKTWNKRRKQQHRVSDFWKRIGRLSKKTAKEGIIFGENVQRSEGLDCKTK